MIIETNGYESSILINIDTSNMKVTNADFKETKPYPVRSYGMADSVNDDEDFVTYLENLILNNDYLFTDGDPEEPSTIYYVALKSNCEVNTITDKKELIKALSAYKNGEYLDIASITIEDSLI